jgi:hypothetical protein
MAHQFHEMWSFNLSRRSLIQTANFVKKLTCVLISGIIASNIASCPMDGCLPNSCTVSGSNSMCSECQASYYLGNGNACFRCSSICLSCLSGSVCTSCQTGLFLDSTSQSCLSCPSDCSNCTAKDKCSTCVNGYSLDNSSVCQKDTVAQTSISALSPLAIIGYCLSGLLCMVCCWLQYLYQAKRLEDERRKLMENKKESSGFPIGSPEPNPQNRQAIFGPESVQEFHPHQFVGTSNLNSNKGTSLPIFSSEVSTARNLNMAVEVSVSNHIHISKKASSARKLVIKNANGLKPRRSGFGVTETTPRNCTDKISIGKSQVDKLSMISGIMERELPTPTKTWREPSRVQQGFNIFDVGESQVSGSDNISEIQGMLGNQSSSNKNLYQYKPHMTESTTKLNEDSKPQTLEGSGISAPKLKGRIEPSVSGRGRSTTSLVKPSTQKELAVIKEESNQLSVGKVKKAGEESKKDNKAVLSNGIVTRRELPKIHMDSERYGTQDADSFAKSCGDHPAGGSQGRFSVLRDLADDNRYYSSNKAILSENRLESKQRSPQEQFQNKFSRQAADFAPSKIGPLGRNIPLYESANPKISFDFSGNQPAFQSRRVSDRSPAQFIAPKS